MAIKHKIKVKDKSVFEDKTVSDDYKTGGAYKAMLSLFADHVSEEEYAEHCRKFFKGDNEDNT
tara:strand:- start:30 stop:218 length:189 start_codon:yes stop_codon:yes gene_type:complete